MTGRDLAFAQDPAKTAIFKLNAQIAMQNDPVWLLLREDSLAGELGRLGFAIGSGLESIKRGYKRQIGPFSFYIREAGMPTDGRPGVSSSIRCPLAEHLILDLENCSPVDFSQSSVQRARLSFEIHL